MRINLQPVAFCSLVYERHLHIGCLLTRVHLAGSNNMVEIQSSFCVRSLNTDFIHTFLGCTFHISLVANPCGTPSCEIYTERERSTDLAVLEKLETDFLVLSFFIIYPNYEGRQIEVLAGRIKFLKFQIFLERQYGTRLICPLHTVKSIFIMFVINA